MEPDDLSVAAAFFSIGQCLRETGRLGEAETFLK